MLRISCLWLVPVVLAFTGCSAANGSDFSQEGSSSPRGADDPSTPNTPADQPNNPPMPQDAGQPSPPDPSGYDPPTELGCASRAQEILILDFRSGWWSGGGGGDYSSIALPAVVSACPSTSVDYHHFEIELHVKCVYSTGGAGGCLNLPPALTVADIRASFEKQSIGDYTQIWILSGSDQDPTDIPVGDALFQGVLGDTAGTCIPLLVAAGDGFVTHANTISSQLGMGNVFVEETFPPSFFSVDGVAAQATTTLSGPSLSGHLLFKDVASITDQVGSYWGTARGDSLVESAGGPGTYYHVIAHDSTGKASIAVGAAKVAGDGYRPFIFDAGWQRSYVLGNGQTAQYLKNIVMYMGLVGCKAAPIGPIT